MARARWESGRRTTAASPPGRWTVRPMMRWSYCSHTQRLLARSGQAASLSGAAGGVLRAGARGLDRGVGHHLAAHLQNQVPRVGEAADFREVELPLLEDGAGLFARLR